MDIYIGITAKIIGITRNVYCENSIYSFVVEGHYQSNISFLIELFMIVHCPIEHIFTIKMKVGELLIKYN